MEEQIGVNQEEEIDENKRTGKEIIYNFETASSGIKGKQE